MNTIRIIVLGDGRVGKTSIIRQLQEKKFTKYYHVTITPIKRRIKIEGIQTKKINLCIYDTPGMETFRNVNKIYMKKNQIVLLIYDITNHLSFDNLHFFFQETKEMNRENNIQFVIVSNKNDLYEDQIVSKEDGEVYAKRINALFFEVTSLDYESIYNMFIIICEEYLQSTEDKKFYKNISDDDNTIKIKKYSNGIYIGQLKNDKRNGEGKMKYDNGDEYNGYWKNDKKDGTGKMIYDNEDEYNGKWENDMFIEGTITYNNDEEYKGKIENEKKNGYGEMTYYNGNIYKGNWKNDKRNGQGELTFKKNNKTIKGEWIDDQLKKGEIEYSNGDKYNGEININKRNGEGEMTYKDIGIYNGNWENDKRNGYGVFNYNNKNKYEGNWENDKRNGKGKLKFNEGEYDGEWKNDMKNGEGTIKYNNKKILKGNFINDKREGDFIVTFLKNKDKIEIKFKNDKIIGEGIYRFYNENKIIKGIFDDNFNLIKGKLKEEDSEYEGEFNDEYNKEGKGILKYNNGIIYEGEFKNNKMNGRGFLCLNDKDYKLLKDNEILFNNQNIKEIFKLNISDYIVKGKFQNDIQKGDGMKYSGYNNKFFLNNIIYIGNLYKNIKKGEGKVYFSNECYFEAIWENDEKIDESKSGKFHLNKSKIINETNSTKQWEKKIQKEILIYNGNNKLKTISSNEIK